jgi:surface protein
MPLTYSAEVSLDLSLRELTVTLPVYAHDSAAITGGANPQATPLVTTNEFEDSSREIQPAVDGYKSVTGVDVNQSESRTFKLDVLPVIEIPFVFTVDTQEILYSGYDYIRHNSFTDRAVIKVWNPSESDANVFEWHWRPGSRPTTGATVISSPSDSYTLPTVFGGNYDFEVDWGDGQSDTITSWDQAEVTHQYSAPGLKEITITGTFEGVNFHRHVGADGTGGTGYTDCKKLRDVISWGSRTIIDISSAVNTWLPEEHPSYQESYLYHTKEAGVNSLQSGIKAAPFVGCSNWNNLSELPPKFAHVPNTAVMRRYNNPTEFLYQPGVQNYTGKWLVGSNQIQAFVGNNNLTADLSNWGNDESPMNGSMYQLARRAPSAGDDFKANWVFKGTPGYQSFDSTAVPEFNILEEEAVVINASGSLVSHVTHEGDIGLIDKVKNLPKGACFQLTRDSKYLLLRNFVTNFDITNWDPDWRGDGSTAQSTARQAFQNCQAFDGDTAGFITPAVHEAESAFKGCTSFTGKGVETWDTSSLSDPVYGNFYGFGSLFLSCSSFNKPLNHFVFSGHNGVPVSINNMLSNCISFDQNCSTWDLSEVSSIASLFEEASSFNNGGASWTNADLRKCRNFYGVFKGTQFDQDISRWRIKDNDTGSMSMKFMFYNCPFNKPIDTHEIDGVKYWDMSTVTQITQMFAVNDNFNQPLNNWDTSNIKFFERAFDQATSFSQDLNNWDVSRGEKFSYIFNGSAMNGDVSTWTFREDGPIESEYMFGNCPILFEGGKDLSGWNTSQFNNLFGMFYNSATKRRAYWGEVDPSKLTHLYNGAYYYPNWSPNVGGWNVSNVTSFSNTFFTAGTFNDDISGWDVGKGTSFVRFVKTCFEFDQNLSSWNMSSATTLHEMFSGCVSFNNGGDSGINNWDVSNVNDMGEMFLSCHSFNQPIGSWDVSNVSIIHNMFRGAKVFNQDLSGWNVGSATSFQSMFYGANDFNSNLPSWNTSNVTDMSYTFREAADFNGTLTNWNTSNVTTMEEMFRTATSFNQPIGQFNTSNVTTMSRMLNGATSFDQSLANWDLSSVTNVDLIFHQSGMSKANLDATLQGWCANSNTPSGLDLSTIPLNGTTETLDSATTTAMSAKGMTATYTNGNSVY